MAPFSAIKEAAPDAYADLAIELPSGPESRLFRPSEELAPSGWCVVSARPILQIIAESGGLLGIHPAERRLVSLDPADAARAGAVSEVADLVDELCKLSPEFAALWRDNDVNVHGEGVKRLRHPVLGPIALEYSAFAVDGRPDLSMVVYNPATRADADLIRSLVASTTMVKKES
jgi:hypothetical protein